jgi:hypothetical protein
MTETELALLTTLRELEAAARAMLTAHPKPSLLPLFSRIEALAGQLPAGADPDLLHCLQRKSYRRALDVLEQRAP